MPRLFFLCLTPDVIVIEKIETIFLYFRRYVMKSKLFAVLAVATALSACSSDGFDLSKFTTVDANASAKTRLRACLISEANTKFQNGTLFAQGLTATAQELSGTCLKKLALQSAGLGSESESMASTIIQNLQNYGTAQ